MTCSACNHAVKSWWPEGRYDYEWTGNREDEIYRCTLNPVWLDVKADHFCSHETRSRTAADFDEMRRNNIRHWREKSKLRERALTAEKKLKAVRKELRELKKK